MIALVVREVDYEAVAHWRSLAARDHVALGQTRNTTWYGAFLRGSTLVGVAGVIRIGKAHRIKGVYVPRALRGQGIGTALTAKLIARHRDDLIEVLAYNPAFYQERGFELVGSPRAGVSRLIRRPG